MRKFKWCISKWLFHFLKILVFWVKRMGGGGGGRRAKNCPKWQNKFVSLCISGTVLHMIVIFGTHVWNDVISSNFFPFFQNPDFSGFSIINAKRNFWGVPHPLHMCVIFFSVSLSNPFKNFICNIMLLANWQDNYFHTYQIWFQMFHFLIASYQFPIMSSKMVDMWKI